MNNYCDINSNQEDGFKDFTFDIINYKKKLFGNLYIECAARDGNDIVGFALEIKNNMTGLMVGPDGIDINSWHTYDDGFKLIYLDKFSDNLIKCMAVAYGVDDMNLKLNKLSVIACGSLTEEPLDYKNKEIRFKCFVDGANINNSYAEFYINIDLKNKKLYLNEKDVEYRQNIIKYFGR